MKTWTIALVMASAMLASSCGYSSHSTTPPAAGNVPTISQLSPNTATHGTGAFSMTVTGKNFNGNAVINFNGTAMTTSPVTGLSGTEVQATIPAASIMNAGNVQVTVTNPGTPGTGQYGGGGTAAETSQPMTFTIN